MRRRGIIITIVAIIIVAQPIVSFLSFIVTTIFLPGKIRDAAVEIQKRMSGLEPVPSGIAIILFALVIATEWMADERRAKIMEWLYGTKGVRFTDEIQQGEANGLYRLAIKCVGSAPTEAWATLDSIAPKQEEMLFPLYLPLSGEVRSYKATLHPDEARYVELFSVLDEYNNPFGNNSTGRHIQILNADRSLAANLPATTCQMAVTLNAAGMSPRKAVFEFNATGRDKPSLRKVSGDA
jgi:hypothetical protein